MEEKNIATILDCLGEVIRTLKFELYIEKCENKQLKAELAEYKEKAEVAKNA